MKKSIILIGSMIVVLLLCVDFTFENKSSDSMTYHSITPWSNIDVLQMFKVSSQQDTILIDQEKCIRNDERYLTIAHTLDSNTVGVKLIYPFRKVDFNVGLDKIKVDSNQFTIDLHAFNKLQKDDPAILIVYSAESEYCRE